MFGRVSKLAITLQLVCMLFVPLAPAFGQIGAPVPKPASAAAPVTASLCKMRLCEFFTPSRSTGLTDFIKVIMRFLGLTIVLVATVGIIIGGLFYIFSAGDEGKAERGKSIIIASIIGLSVVFMSYLIVTLLQTFIYSFGGV